MCGIAGIATGNGAPPDEVLLRLMNQALSYRGPDGDGIFVEDGIGLAHRRLAIIDLSSNGAQPMRDVSGKYAIIFNGEIYNYQELRNELQNAGSFFKSQSDTEVILEGYRKWGKEIVRRLHGMFAFAIWDIENKELFLARDKIGKKPLYYSLGGRGDIFFASEIKSLFKAVSMEPDLKAVRLFFGLQYVPSPLTGFKNIFQLSIGCLAIWKRESGLKIEKYHDWKTSQVIDEKNGDNLDQDILLKLERAVKMRQLASDVPVGAFLSGGIDSAAVVALASQNMEQPLKTFTMGFSQLEMDERDEARMIAKHFGTNHHEFEARPDDMLRLLDQMVDYYDAPYADSSALPLWLLAEQTAKSVKVVLTGDGGDEIFGGYRRYVAFLRAQGLSKLPLGSTVLPGLLNIAGKILSDSRYCRIGEVISAFGKDADRAYGEMFCGSYFNSRSIKELCSTEFLKETEDHDSVDFISKQMFDNSQKISLLERAMFFDLTSYLPDDLNVKMDRATMRFGLEARSPFLDQNVIALGLRLPLGEKIKNGYTKIALRRVLAKILPAEVLSRPKRGFQVPLATWFRGPLSSLIRERCLGNGMLLANLVHKKSIERLIAENDRGMDHGNRLWMLLSLATWLQKFSL